MVDERTDNPDDRDGRELSSDELELVSGGASVGREQKTYVVQAGDTLSEIAEKYGTTTKKLSILNSDILISGVAERGIKVNDPSEYANYIFPGQVLRLS